LKDQKKKDLKKNKSFEGKESFEEILMAEGRMKGKQRTLMALIP
jgi:hypothetical protein